MNSEVNRCGERGGVADSRPKLQKEDVQVVRLFLFAVGVGLCDLAMEREKLLPGLEAHSSQPRTASFLIGFDGVLFGFGFVTLFLDFQYQ